MVGENLAFSWACLCSFATKPVFSTAQMNAGYYFPNVYPTNSISFELSTQAKIERINLRAIPKFTPSGAWTTYQIGLPSGITLPAVG